jgi:hypothetical protein
MKRIELMYLQKSDLELFGYKLSNTEWNEIVVNLSWINTYSYDTMFYVMNNFDSYEEFIERLVETKGTFPDWRAIPIQQNMYRKSSSQF